MESTSINVYIGGRGTIGRNPYKVAQTQYSVYFDCGFRAAQLYSLAIQSPHVMMVWNLLWTTIIHDAEQGMLNSTVSELFWQTSL